VPLGATASDLTVAALGALIATHTAALVAVIVLLARVREKVTRLEEWARLEEKWRSETGEVSRGPLPPQGPDR
jgi:hypothetical protein